MKIAVVGAGGVGGYFGGLLARSGQEVGFIARGAHLEAIRKQGLEVRSIHGDFHVRPAWVTDDPAIIGPVDLVLVCVKDYQLAAVLPIIRQLVNKDSSVIPLLNGVRAADILADELGGDVVLGGLCRVVSFKSAPGVIEQVSPFRAITFGEFNGQSTKRAESIRLVLEKAGIETFLTAEIRVAMWTKFLFIAAYSGVASIVRLPAGYIRSGPETMDLMRRSMEEIRSIARALDIHLGENIIQDSLAFFNDFPEDATASMQRDVQEGRMFELEALIGTIVLYGAKLDIPTPVNDVIYAALKPQERRARETIQRK